MLELDISENDITEISLRYLGVLLTKFQGIKYLNISKSYRLSTLFNEYFFDCLCVNLIKYNRIIFHWKS